MTGSYWTAPVVAVAGGLVLLLSAGADWVVVDASRDVGGVTVAEATGETGTTFAPWAMVAGLTALVAAVGLALLRTRARIVLGAAVAAAGIVALAAVLIGIRAALSGDGNTTPAPYLALAAALAVVVGGAVAVTGPVRPPAASRYRVEEEQPDDDEWTIAADDDPTA